MTPPTIGPTNHPPAPDRDALISRLIDAEATADDWAEFKRLAAEDPAIWSELSDAQRDHDRLLSALEAEIAIADTIEAPIEAHLAHGLTQRLRLVASYGGWAAAALILLSFTLGGRALGLPQPSGDGVVRAGLIPMVTAESDPDDALSAYLTLGQRTGRVIGEAPEFVVLESRPAATGDGVEIVYLRQLIERRTVESVYRFDQDEFGNPTPTRVETPRLTPGAL